MTELTLRLHDVDVTDLTDDIDTLLSFCVGVVDLSPSFQRLLSELDQVLIDRYRESVELRGST